MNFKTEREKIEYNIEFHTQMIAKDSKKVEKLTEQLEHHKTLLKYSQDRLVDEMKKLIALVGKSV